MYDEEGECFCFFKKLQQQCIIVENDGILSIYRVEEEFE
jgi:hypothetical protein